MGGKRDQNGAQEPVGSRCSDFAKSNETKLPHLADPSSQPSVQCSTDIQRYKREYFTIQSSDGVLFDQAINALCALSRPRVQGSFSGRPVLWLCR